MDNNFFCPIYFEDLCIFGFTSTVTLKYHIKLFFISLNKYNENKYET